MHISCIGFTKYMIMYQSQSSESSTFSLTGKGNARCLLLTYFSNKKILRKWPSQNMFFEFPLKIEANNAWNSLFWFLWQHLCSLWWNNAIFFFKTFILLFSLAFSFICEYTHKTLKLFGNQADFLIPHST